MAWLDAKFCGLKIRRKPQKFSGLKIRHKGQKFCGLKILRKGQKVCGLKILRKGHKFCGLKIRRKGQKFSGLKNLSVQKEPTMKNNINNNKTNIQDKETKNNIAGKFFTLIYKNESMLHPWKTYMYIIGKNE